MHPRQMIYDKIYKERQKLKGNRRRIVLCTDQQWQILKTILFQLRKIPKKKIEWVAGLDVSNDLLTYKILIEEPKQFVVNENREIVRVVDKQWASVMKEAKKEAKNEKNNT